MDASALIAIPSQNAIVKPDLSPPLLLEMLKSIKSEAEGTWQVLNALS